MKIVKTFYANDGKKFDDEFECRKYEQMLMEKVKKRKEKEQHEVIVLQNVKDLDYNIWKKYHPEYDGKNEPDLNQAIIWLKNDISSIMVDFPNSENDILNLIKNNEFGNEIITMIEMNEIRDDVNIRTDFFTALNSVKRGSDLSHRIGYALTPKDLSKLALLHKQNKCRNKIEELLTDCKFHYECCQFENQNYEEFLNIEKTA